ncbi:CynX/NimT family MFS transporter [Chloroflexota bacterium]
MNYGSRHEYARINGKSMDSKPGATSRETRRRWAILGVIYLCVLAFAVTLQSVPPILSLVMAELDLSHTQGGLLMSLFALPGIIVSIPAGMLADRYGQKSLGIVSLILIISGAVIFASGSSLPILGLGRIVAGMGAMTLVVLAPQLLAQWFVGREMGIATGIYTTAMPLGTILSLNFLSLLGQSFGWRASAWLSAGLPVVALVIFVLFFAPAPRRSQPITRRPVGLFQNIKSAGTPIWFVGAAWMLFNASGISLFTFTPDLLKGTGVSIASAGFLTSLVMLPALVISPLIGYVIHKIDRKRTIIAIGGVAMAILVVSVPTATGWILVLMLLIGVAQVLIPTPIFALVPEVISLERVGLGYGIIAASQNLGIVIGPAAVGLVRDVTSSYQASYALMAILSFLVMVDMFILNRRKNG